MPYSVDKLDELPTHVKKLKSDTKKRQWVHVFNSELAKHNDEGRAFATANSVAAKELIGDWYDLDKWLQSEFASPPGLSRFWKGSATNENEPATFEAGIVSPTDKANDKSVIKSIIDSVKSIVASAVTIPAVDDGNGRAFRVVQMKDGRLRWWAVPTNQFRDRQNEIITEEAHKEYVEWVGKSGVYPELWLWHSGPKSRWGMTDFVDYSDGFLVASGLVDEGKEYIAHNLAGKDLGVSHGFFSAKKDGIINKYRTFELSPLPAWAAANTWTSFAILTNKDGNVSGMAFTEKKRDWLISDAGMTLEEVKAMETSLSDLANNLKQRGIGYKDMADMFSAVATTEATAGTGTSIGTTAVVKSEEPSATSDTSAGTEGETKTKKDIEDLQGAVKSLTEKFDAFMGRVEPLMVKASKSVDDRTADYFRAATSAIPQGHQASTDSNNIVGDKQQKDDQDWFGSIFNSMPVGDGRNPKATAQ